MTVISKRFADELSEKEMRDAYLSAQIRTKLTNQIRAIRSLRGWSQGEFAKILGKPQSNVSRLENREYGSFTLNTLFELASAFDVGLVVEFVPYDDFLRRTHDLSPSHLQVGSFSKTSLEPLYRNGVATGQVAAVVAAIAGISPQLEGLVHQVTIGGGTNSPIGHAPQGMSSFSFVTTGASGTSIVAAAGSTVSVTTINPGFSGGSLVNQLGSGVQSAAFGD
jgi:transcriptional regulator with XRE-family HTH domain